jgi:glucans biosynthesis protein
MDKKMSGITRRDALSGLAAALGAAVPARSALAASWTTDGLAYGPARPFSFEAVKREAATLAAKPFEPLDLPYADLLQQIDYDAFFQIAFRRDQSVWQGGGEGAPIQLFHLGRYVKEPVSIAVVEEGAAREILYRQSSFDMPPLHVARQLPPDIGFAGFRVMSEDQTWDWLSFLGASYFRSPGAGKQYGMSARGLAIDTAMPGGEEFPRFTKLWLESVPGERGRLIVNALLEGPSVAGAYRFDCRRDKGVVMEVEMEVHPRKAVERLGIAPLTSMFWYGEKDRRNAPDWRPEIHDSDGLAVWTGAGERIWRPLNNPSAVMTNSFADESPKGFGLMQRDRDFDHYQDDGVFYDRRPSVWVEPVGEWGRGTVQLVEIPTVDETHDNIVAYWVPEGPVRPGQPLAFRYRLHWAYDEPQPTTAARAGETFIGMGGQPGQERPRDLHQFVVDFSGGDLGRFGPKDGVTPVVSASRGEIVRSAAYPVVDRPGLFRSAFELKAEGHAPVDVRLYLKRGGEALTETWIYQYFPEDPRLGASLRMSAE